MTETVSATTTPDRVRCSDADRERIATRLRDAASEGRLSMEELDERLAAVYAAKYHDDLAPVLADLPAAKSAATGWRAVLALLWAQLVLEMTTLRGRRLVLAGVAVLLVLAITGSVLGFGGEGFEHDHGH